MLDEIPPHLLRKKFEGNEAKPYADFTMPELVHLNKPEWPNYLKAVKQNKVRVINKNNLINKPKVEVFRVPRLEKNEPYSEEAFRRIVKSCKMKNSQSSKHDDKRITHLSEQRTVPIGTYAVAKIGL